MTTESQLSAAEAAIMAYREMRADPASIDLHGCVIACLAMIAGCSYATMRSRLLEWGLFEHGARGLTEHQLGTALDRLGFEHSVMRVRGDRFKISPFAPIHLALVLDPRGTTTDRHTIVMLADGTTLDPSPMSTIATLDDYLVDAIAGVWRKD